MDKKNRWTKFKKLAFVVGFLVSVISISFSLITFLKENIATYKITLLPYSGYMSENKISESFAIMNTGNRTIAIYDIWYSYGNIDTKSNYIKHINDVEFPIKINTTQVVSFLEYKDNIPELAVLYSNAKEFSEQRRLELKSKFYDYERVFPGKTTKMIEKVIFNSRTREIGMSINISISKINSKPKVYTIPFDIIIIPKDINIDNSGYVPVFVERKIEPRKTLPIIRKL